jgi:phage FluMu gp28-like protein
MSFATAEQKKSIVKNNTFEYNNYVKSLELCDEIEARSGLPLFIIYDPTSLLHGYQKRWIADESPLKIGEKSRRIGLTFGEAADAVLVTSKSRAAGGTNHFYLGTTKEMAREFIDACSIWARAYDKAAGEIQEEVFIEEGKDGKEIQVFAIYFASGFKIQALSSNAGVLRGRQGNVTIDEAAHHKDLAEVLKAALALKMLGGKIRVISTHNGVLSVFNSLIEQSRKGEKSYSIHRTTIEDACAEGLYFRICNSLARQWSPQNEKDWIADLLKDTFTEEDALEEYYCVPKQSSGVYIPRVLVEHAMNKDIPILRFTAPKDFLEWSQQHKDIQIKEWKEQLKPHLEALNKNLHHSFGEDFARKGDLSVFTPLQINKNLTKRVPFLLELSNLTYKAQEELMFYICDHLPRLQGMAFDATGNGGFLAEAAAERYGTDMVEQVMITDRWYMEWMPKFKVEFEDMNIQIPKHQDIIDDMGQIQVINGIPKIDKGSTKGTDGRQRHGDFAVSGCMAVRASWMLGSAIEYTPLPEKNRNEDDNDYISNSKGAY